MAMRASSHHQHEQGQALVEFALMLPILLVLIFGIIDIARLMYAFSQAIDATRQAMRYGIVTGLDNSTPQYLDCQNITAVARRMLFMPGLNNVTINVRYEDAQGNFISNCVDTLTAWDVNDGDVLVVEVQGAISPITPAFMLFTNTLPFSYTSRRTIMTEGTAYTQEWPTAPQGAQNFRATVDCNRTTNNVSFTWDPMNMPDRAEIRDIITSAVVVELDDIPPGLIANAFCDDCATVDPNGGFAMYYLVAYEGTPPHEVAGPPSNEAVVMCAQGAISGVVWNDLGSRPDGRRDEGEPGIAGVTVNLVGAGRDGSFGTADDVTATQTTDANGVFMFRWLEAGDYRIAVDESSTALVGMTRTTRDNPVSIRLSDGGTGNANFGYAAAF